MAIANAVKRSSRCAVGFAAALLLTSCFLHDAILGPKVDRPQGGDDIILGSIKNLTDKPVIWDAQGLADIFAAHERRGIDPKVREGLIAAVGSVLEDRGFNLVQEKVRPRKNLHPQPIVKKAAQSDSEESASAAEPEVSEVPAKRYLLDVDIMKWDVTLLRPAGTLEAGLRFRLIDDIHNKVLWEDSNSHEVIHAQAGEDEMDLSQCMEAIVKDGLASLKGKAN